VPSPGGLETSADHQAGRQGIPADPIVDRKALARVLADFAHEVRTPLTAIIGFSSLLNRTDGLSDDARVYARLIEDAGHILAASVSRVAEHSSFVVDAAPGTLALVDTDRPISQRHTINGEDTRSPAGRRAMDFRPVPPDGTVCEPGKLSGLRVLIVDDHRHIRDILAAALGAFGMIISTACDGQTCLDALALLEFDVVLMDYRMPGLSGAEVLALVRLRAGPNQNVPVIAVTAELTPLNAYVFELFDGLLTKPVSFDALACTILDVLGLHVPTSTATSLASA
jgi:CheY-like chemotaxis protein